MKGKANWYKRNVMLQMSQRNGVEQQLHKLTHKEYLFRTITAIIFFLTCAYINVCSSVIAGYRTPNIRIMNADGSETIGRILPDLGHVFMDYITQYMNPTLAYYWDNIDPNFFISNMLNGFIVLLLIHPQRLMIMRRVSGVIGYIFLARSLCVLCTSMPDSHRQCFEQFGTPNGDYKNHNIFPEAFFVTLQTMGAMSDSVTCGDMIFSGHMVICMATFLVFSNYCNSRDMSSPLINYLPRHFCTLYRWFMYFCLSTGALAIIKSHLHYSVDVVIAFYFTLNSWNVYHRTARDILNKNDSKGSRLWEFSPFSPFFGWLESTEMQVQDVFVWESKRQRKTSDSYDDDDDDDDKGDIPLISHIEGDRQV